MPNAPDTYNTFHTSQVLPFVENDKDLFPSREYAEPPPVVTEDGLEEWFVDSIIAERARGKGFQYLVRYSGYGPEHDRWMSGRELKDNAALDTWLAGKGSG
ncbi:hypothetical protein LshimejAT787_2001120 [Lyophyllum shimeji]|uniref:Chromo domain-containing protein n=1 Tax=Lyophyllum shimeji TaxID=47721 RepID=A0A9P3UUJ0_LYOSH|nr:hypothetical protein LshimejAT787_2001120 [Lyophyllum shimeji]